MTKALARALSAAGVVAACSAAAAGSDGVSIGPARLEVARLSQPSVLAIGKRDVDQGFIDLPNASSFELGGNGDFVVSTSNAPYISVVRVHLSTAPHDAGRPPRRRFVLSYRIYLNPKTTVGVHPWPFGIQSSAR